MSVRDLPKNIIKRCAYTGLPLLFYAMRVFPIKRNKITVSNYAGKGCGDNAKYIINACLDSGRQYDIVWIVNKKNEPMPEGVRTVRHFSLRSVYELCTSRVWIDNCRKPAYYRKRRGQVYIQTWHGDIGPKKAEGDAVDVLDRFYIEDAMHDSDMINYFVSGNRKFTYRIRRAYWYGGKILEIGSPRRDILYTGDREYINRIKKALNVGEDTKIVLYAPTFRSGTIEKNIEVCSIDWNGVLDAVRERFGGEWVGAVRLHPNLSAHANEMNVPAGVLNVTGYADMQELLLASDICISDYSSALFEFAITGKPGFIYAVDYEDYKNDRDMYFQFGDTPFPIAESSSELENAIRGFDSDRYAAEYAAFYNDFTGVYKEGAASQYLSELIGKVCFGK